MDGGRGRLRRMGAELSGREWRHVVAMFGFILALNAAGWGIYLLVVMPHHFDYRGGGAGYGQGPGLGVGLGVAITAWYPFMYLNFTKKLNVESKTGPIIAEVASSPAATKFR